MSDELATIAIPTFNSASTIEAAVASCLAQTYSQIEVVVVDDGSTDATPEVLRRFGSRIRVIRQANQGLAAARNAGHRAATGAYVAWMDADDLALPDRLRMQIAALGCIPGADLVCTNFSAFTDASEDFDPCYIDVYYGALARLGGTSRVFPNEVQSKWCSIDQLPKLRWGHVYDEMLAGNFVHPPTVMLRRSLFEHVGEFDLGLRYSSDYDFLLRASRITAFGYIGAPLIRYRCHPQQMSHAAKSGKLQLETLQILRKARAADAGLDIRRGDDMRRFSAEALLSAAQAIARTDRTEAMRLLYTAQFHHVLPVASLRALARIATPNFAVDAVKGLRNKWRSATPQ